MQRVCEAYMWILDFSLFRLCFSPFILFQIMAAAGGWSSLPAELLSEASGRLSADADQLHIHEVCTHWRASTSRLAACRPWIVAGREPWRGVGPIGDHSFWLPHGGQRIYLGAPAGLPYCCGTPLGWLALTDDLRSPTRFILWEPLAKVEILMPCLPAVAQVFLSGDPLTSSDWMAIASQKTSRSDIDIVQKLFFWRPGDAAWTVQLEQATARIDSAVFHQRRFYFTDMSWHLHAYDLEASPPNRVWALFLYPAVNRVCTFGRWHGLRAVHLVAFNGDLLLAVLQWMRHGTLAAEVYRPNWTAESRLELRERVTDLGEYSLFLGRGNAFALSATEFPSIRRNCVYFVEHDKFKHEHWAIVFDLGSNASEQIPYSEEHRVDGSDSNYWLAYSWFCLRGPFLKQ